MDEADLVPDLTASVLPDLLAVHHCIVCVCLDPVCGLRGGGASLEAAPIRLTSVSCYFMYCQCCLIRRLYTPHSHVFLDH